MLPRTAPEYDNLVVVRCILGITMAAPLAHPLVADYVHRDSRGKALALSSMGIVIGEILAMSMFKLNLILNMDFYDSFSMSALMIMVFSLYFFYAVKDPDLRKIR